VLVQALLAVPIQLLAQLADRLLLVLGRGGEGIGVEALGFGVDWIIPDTQISTGGQ
jgi:hypothetical protein